MFSPSPSQAPQAEVTDDDFRWVGSQPPSFGSLLAAVPRFPAKAWHHRDLILSSVLRELRARFQGTLLGWFWPLSYPLFMFAVYYFIFAQLLELKIPDLNDGEKAAIGIFMFVGVLIWTGFAEGINRGCAVIVENGNLIKKLAFPTELLPFNVAVVGQVTMAFGVAAFVVVLWASQLAAVLGWVSMPLWPKAPGLELVWVPVLMLVQLIFTYGVGLILATMQVFLRDTLQMLSILVVTWMFLSPVFWVPSPEVMPGIAQYFDVLSANPIFDLLHAWRVILMCELPAVAFAEQPEFLQSLGRFTLWAVGTWVVGYLFFLKSQRRFADEV